MAINQDVLNKYNILDWKKLLRGDLGDSGKLDEIEPNLQRIKNIFERILSYISTLEQVPNYERTFESVINQFVDTCNSEIINGYSDVSQRQEKLTRVRQLEESFIGQLSPIFNYLQFVDPANNTKQEELEKKSKEIENKLEEIDNLTKKVQKAVAVSGSIAEGQEVKSYGTEFESISQDNKGKAFRSQVWMLVSLFLTVLIACIFVFGKRIDLQEGSVSVYSLWNTILEQNVLLKIVVISAGGYLVAYFSRNYSAEMNMYYTNKHRQLALNSHQRILDAVRETETNNEAEIKNAILLQVAKTMFGIQETGYLKNGNNPVPTAQIVETIRAGVSKNN